MKYILLFLLFLMVPIKSHAETLILLIDMSYSVSFAEEELQKNGYISALSNIRGLEKTNFEVVYFNLRSSHISSGGVKNAISALENAKRPKGNSTCIADALEYVETIIPTLQIPITLDISGDGYDNCNKRLTHKEQESIWTILDRIATNGVRINTLSIGEELNIDKYFANMTRNYGFHIHVENFNQFEGAVYRKIAREIAEMR